MKQTIERLAKFLVYATFFIPLVVVSSSFIFPFIVPKILLFRTSVILLLGCYVLLLLCNWQEYRPRLAPLSIAVLLFFVSFTLSTFLGTDAYHSFWDNHERMLGLFTIAHYVIYYFIVTALFKTWTDWKWALRVFLLAGSIVMFIGMLQVANPDLLLNQGNNRIASTLGNPIYVGGYGLFLFFVALLLVIREQDVLWRYGAALGGILALLGVFYSGTRGSIIGFLAGVLAAIVGYVIILRNRPTLRRGMSIALVAVAMLVAAVYVYRQTPLVQNIPGVSRLLGTTLKDFTSGTRFIAWKVAIDSWKERPVFGWGPNNYFYAFNAYYNPRSLEFGYGETWFDNAHNIILNTLTVQGIVGLLSYVGIFVVAVFALWRSSELRQKNIHLVVIGSAFLAAHLVQNITVFENPTSYLYFMFWLALVNKTTDYRPQTTVTMPSKAVVSSPSTVVKNDNKEIGVGAGIIGSVAAACGLLIFIFNIQPARANTKTLAALSAFGSNPVGGFAVAQDALTFSSPHIDDIRADIARMVTDVMARQYQTLPKEKVNEILETTRSALQKNIELHPRDIRNYMSLAQLEQISFAATNDARHVVAAHNAIETALQYSPRRQQLVFMLSSMKAQLGQKDEAVKLMEQVIIDDPKIGESYWRLAFILHYTGNSAKAREVLATAHQRGINFDAQGQQVEAQIMAESGTKK